MQKRLLGTSKVQITPILMGTWQAGKRMWVGVEDADSIKTIRAAYEAGITTVDTAEVYGEGHSEQIVAEALSDVRTHVEYATKVFANHLKYEQVIEACERSLTNLKTDYIDLYQIHWPSGAFNSEIVPIEETMSALNLLKEQGKIRAIGVSNFSHAQLAEAASYGRIDSSQPPYSLFWRQVEQDVLPYCIENNISILAYSSLAQGLLTGKFAHGHKFDLADNRAKNKLFQGENFERAQQALQQLRPIALLHNCTLAQLALAWLIAQPQTNAIAYYQQTVAASPSPLTKVQAQLNHLRILIEDQRVAEIQTLLPLIESQIDQLPLSRASIYAQVNFSQSLAKVKNGILHASSHNYYSGFSTKDSAVLLARAIQQSRSLGDKRTEAYALKSLGGLYEETKQWAEAQDLSRKGLALAQSSNAPEIIYTLEWQLGRLLRAQKDINGAIAAYDAAVETLQSLRRDLVANKDVVNQDVQFNFRNSVEPIYRESVELLLKSQEGKSPNEKILEKARERIEALQLAELNDFFQEACLQGQTATGDRRATLGLAGAAVRAGARSTIAWLWQIDDKSTAMFVSAFYRELKSGKITKAEAVHRAQLELLKHPNYKAPGFWSAYVLIGNWL